MIRATEYTEKNIKRMLDLLGVEDTWQSGESIWPLPNMKEIPLSHFFWARTSYSFSAEISTGQFRSAERDPASRSGHPQWSHCYVYLTDVGAMKGGGYALLYTYNHMDYVTRKVGDYADALGSKDANHPCVRAYKWLVCDHDWQETGPVERRTRGWHVYTCSKCGGMHDVDSGD